MRRGRALGGFTLLEVILAVALAVAVVAAAFAFYRRALQVREAIITEVEVAAAERAIMGHLTSELRSAMADPFVSSGITGSAGEIQFATVVVPGPTAWAVRNVTDEPITPERDLQLVGYRLRTHEDQQGQVVIDGLERACKTLVSPPTAEEGTGVTTALMSPRIQFLYFRYWDGASWAEGWPGGDLPGAVEITLGLKPLPENVLPQDYPYPTFRRVVFVPEGAKPVTGTVVRGLGGD
jgi:type II secretory pathway component PulJ